MTTMREALELARDVIAGFIEGADPDCGEPDCGDCPAYRPAWAALPIIDAALAEPEPEPVAYDYIQAHKDAEQFVSSSILWKRWIDGTPLSNDIAVWMAEFARKYAAPVAAPAQISDDEIGALWTQAVEETLYTNRAPQTFARLVLAAAGRK